MSNPGAQAMLELADKIKYARERKLIHGTDVSLTYQEMDLAQTALRASAVQGEPVAWRWRTQRGDNWTFSIKRLSIADIGRTSSTFQEEPLYAHPVIGTPDERTELINFVSSIRQHDIDLEVRDQILKKIMALPRAAIGTPWLCHACHIKEHLQEQI